MALFAVETGMFDKERLSFVLNQCNLTSTKTLSSSICLYIHKTY